MKQDEEEDEDEDEDEDEEEDSLLTSEELFRIIPKLILAEFTVQKNRTNRQTNQRTDGQTKPLIEMRGRI